VFTSNLISQTTWLKVKLKLVNLAEGLILVNLKIKSHFFPCFKGAFQGKLLWYYF